MKKRVGYLNGDFLSVDGAKSSDGYARPLASIKIFWRKYFGSKCLIQDLIMVIKIDMVQNWTN